MNYEFLKWLDKITERACEHNLSVWVNWTATYAYLLVADDNTPLLTDEYGSLLVGEGFVEFYGDDFEKLLDRLDGIDPADDDNDDEQTPTPAQA